MICIAIAAMLALTAGAAHAQLCPETAQIASELDALDAEIALIKDLNTLQLTEQQIQSLLPVVADIRSTAIAHAQDRGEILERLKPLLQEKRNLLLRDEQPTDALEEQIAEINNELIDVEARLDAALQPHAEDLRAILSDPQIAIITGEEQARRQVLNLINWIRNLEDAAFEQEVPPLAEELADPEIGLTEEEIIDLLSLARAMSPEQYERAGEEIRGRLIELYRPSAEAADRILVQVFLHESMPTVLEDMLEQM
jgi:hypothetical protein